VQRRVRTPARIAAKPVPLALRPCTEGIPVMAGIWTAMAMVLGMSRGGGDTVLIPDTDSARGRSVLNKKSVLSARPR
jgi:hypothetical protein